MISGIWKKLTKRKPKNLERGEWGELKAEEYLAAKGWKILGRRVRNSSREELDLVARDKDVLVFVEVKTRSGEGFGRPIESVGKRKRQLMCRAAARYLVKLHNPRVYFRFDVVEVLGCPEAGVKEIRHTPNAFPMNRKYSI